jgi:DNA-binding transcriptional regulator YhcF (GntR family)
MTDTRLTDRLRSRILHRAHLSGLKPGERLPGIREVARDTGEDHRAVAEAYRTLEAEGLVEIRGRSGVYLARDRRTGKGVSSGTADWLANFLTEARGRAIPLPDLPDLLTRAIAGRRLRCGCFESTEDQMVAYAWELRKSFCRDKPLSFRGGTGGG